MNFSFYPWGNAYYNVCDTPYFDKEKGMDCWIKQCQNDGTNDKCFSGPILCQHGDDECWANRVEGCAVRHYPSKYVDFLICFEGVHNAERNALAMCSKESDIDVQTLNQCVSSKEGELVDQLNAKETIKLGTSKIGTPWVVVNGQPMSDPSGLLSHVCSVYQGDKPKGCFNQ